MSECFKSSFIETTERLQDSGQVADCGGQAAEGRGSSAPRAQAHRHHPPHVPPGQPGPRPRSHQGLGRSAIHAYEYFLQVVKYFFLIQEVERVRVGEVVNNNPIHQSFAKAKDVEDLYRLADYWLSPSR